ncbi:polysaccharide deacetylase family protein [Paenibacillus sp. P96]|uniref:Polysaccharide deacetylase family protein n=1 Tax=Paenibacillus zeirhizosphaerae TaxID=2987519 RepID=A0ABT9FPL6_9BACL|nr:polysaccharide deacetylase family protein [Paenibacillus sp. P96]MDP4096676.1 polysaccharide deacetylase family protein [Paenibacillus sp. P96]
MSTKAAAILLTSSLLLGACGSDTEPAAPANSAAQSGQADAGKSDAAEQTATSSGTDTAASGGVPAQDKNEPAKTGRENQDVQGTEEQTPKLYRMNSAYNIVPVKDDGTEKKVVLLTFDDGPKEQAMVDSLLDTLGKHGAKAIFFVNGYRVKEHPELLKQIDERGHIIGNHSYDHIVLKNEPLAKVRKQIKDVQVLVKDTIGTAPVFFRPPHGAGGDVGRQVAKEENLLYMTWSNGSLDWTMKKSDPNKKQAVINNVMDQLHPGSNILMHELPWTVEALDELLTKLEQKGYAFVDPHSIATEASKLAP